MSMDNLLRAICEKQNPTVAGLDPKLDYVPQYIKDKAFNKYGETLKGAAKAILEFNKCLIDALHEVVPAIKSLEPRWSLMWIPSCSVWG